MLMLLVDLALVGDWIAEGEVGRWVWARVDMKWMISGMMVGMVWWVVARCVWLIGSLAIRVRWWAFFTTKLIRAMVFVRE